MKKLRIKDLLLKYPALDRARVHTIAAFFQHGLFLYDTLFRRLAVIPEATRPYVSTAGAWNYKPDAMDSLKPAVYAYFHGHMHVLLGLTPRERMTLIVSNSRDGEAIARAAEGMGYQVARGSRTEGGVKGAFKLLGAATNKRSILFPVDGPRGPREVVKPEIIRMAQLANMPIIPVVARPRTMDIMSTWDRYNCPYMNTMVLYIFGAPIFVGTADQQTNLEGSPDVNLDGLSAQTEIEGTAGAKGKSRDDGRIEALRLELETYMQSLNQATTNFFGPEVYPPLFD